MTFTLNQSTHKAISPVLLYQFIFICPYLVAINRSTSNVERLPNVVFRPPHRPLSSTSVYNTFASDWNCDVKRSHLKLCKLCYARRRSGGRIRNFRFHPVTITSLLVKIGDSNATALRFQNTIVPSVVLFTRHYSFKNLLDTTIAISLQLTTHFSRFQRAQTSHSFHPTSYQRWDPSTATRFRCRASLLRASRAWSPARCPRRRPRSLSAPCRTSTR
jgi:hypothetical protein